MNKKRHIIECIWGGYRSGQERVCHRAVTIHPQQWDGLHTVAFTDGTTMSVSIRPCTPREKVIPINGYHALLNEIADKDLSSKGYVSVLDLDKKPDAVLAPLEEGK